jgi:hypothetical protein
VVAERSCTAGACIATLVLCLAACSSGRGKHAAPTTTTLSPSYAVANLGPCPKRVPSDFSPRTLNAGVVHLGARLVPIVALTVRVCRYGSNPVLIGSAILKPTTTRMLEADVNRLTPNPGGLVGCERGQNPPPPPETVLLTFASASQRVFVQQSECDGFWNGRTVTDPSVAVDRDLASMALPSGRPGRATGSANS